MDSLVVVSFVLVGFLQIVVPLFFGLLFAKKFKVSWKVFGFGALFFVLVQIVHVPLVFALQDSLSQYLKAIFSTTIYSAIFSVVLGLLAGLFEEIGRFLVFKYFFKQQKIELKKENALMFGAGWGGIESVFVGIVLFLTMFSYLAAAPLTEKQLSDLNAQYGSTLTAEQINLLKAQNEALINLKPLDLLASLAERLMALVLQIAFSLMVFSAIILGKKRLLALAIVWHAALDAIAVFLGQTSDILAAEAAIFGFALIALFYIKKNLPK